MKDEEYDDMMKEDGAVLHLEGGHEEERALTCRLEKLAEVVGHGRGAKIAEWAARGARLPLR